MVKHEGLKERNKLMSHHDQRIEKVGQMSMGSISLMCNNQSATKQYLVDATARPMGIKLCPPTGAFVRL